MPPRIAALLLTLWACVSTARPAADARVRQASGAVLVVLGGAPNEAAETARRWSGVASARGWRVQAVPLGQNLAPNDAMVKAVEAALAPQAPAPERTYLIGEGAAASAVFYLASRRPDLWAAAAAIGGSPRAAIETNRLFAANTLLTPVLWIPPRGDPTAESFGARLREAGYNLAAPPKAELTVAEVLDWLEAQRRDRHPLKVDCETGHPEFAGCYWVAIRQMDFTRRNDVLGSSRVSPGSGAFLALGPFGFDPSAPGPGVLVTWLPEGYRGPLQVGDRIVALGGKEIQDARAYISMMEQQAEARNTAVILVREGRRRRVETRIVLPKREELVTARVQAEFLPQEREILVVSRGAAALELRLPESWTPARVNWNGEEAGTVTGGGCWELKEANPVRRCAP